MILGFITVQWVLLTSISHEVPKSDDLHPKVLKVMFMAILFVCKMVCTDCKVARLTPSLRNDKQSEPSSL